MDSSLAARLLPALVLALLTSSDALGQVIPLPDLTQPVLRQRVRVFMETAEAVELTKPIAPYVRLLPEQLLYETVNGVPTRFEWRYETLSAWTPDREPLVRETLGRVLERVLIKFNGGLLVPAEARKLVAVARFVPVSVVPVPKPVLGPPPPVPPAYGVVWYYPCCCCCGCGSVPLFLYLPPSPNAAAPPPPTPAVFVAPQLAPPPPPPPTAVELYGLGVNFFWEQNLVAARFQIARAIRLNAMDARFWYFRALAERALGDLEAARISARRAVALEYLQMPPPAFVAFALERVQGADRDFLRSAFDVSMTRETARQIIASPLPPLPPEPIPAPRGGG